MMNSSSLLASDHALHCGGNLTRASRAKCCGNLEPAAHDQHGDDIVDGCAFEQPEASGSHVHGALSVVERIRLIGAAFCQNVSKLPGIVAARKLAQNPRPILFRMGVLYRLQCPCDPAEREHGIIQSKVTTIRDRIRGVFDRHLVGERILAIQRTGNAEHPVAVRASGIAAKDEMRVASCCSKVKPSTRQSTWYLWGDVVRIAVGVGTASDARSSASRASPSVSISIYRWRTQATLSLVRLRLPARSGFAAT